MPFVTFGFRDGTERRWEINDKVLEIDSNFRGLLLQSVGTERNIDFSIRTEVGEDGLDYGWVAVDMGNVLWIEVDGVTDVSRIDPTSYS